MRLMPSAYIPRGSKMTGPPAVDEPGALDAAGDPNSPWRRFMQREVLDPLQTEIIEPGTRPDPKLTNAVTNITRRLTMTGPEVKQAERQDRREARHPSVSLFEPPITGSVSGSPAANQSSTTMGWNPGMPTGDGIMEGLNWFDRILKDHGIGTTGPATSGGSATAPPRMLPDRATHALTPDGQVIPTDRTSDAWGGGTGPSAVGFAADGVTPITVSPSKVIRIDPATGIPGISPTAYVDQTAYNAARQRGDEPWQFTKPEVDVLIGAGLLQPDPNDPADLAGIYTELVDQHALIPAPWTAAINAAVDAGELNPDGTLPGSTPTETPAGAPADTTKVYPVNGATAVPATAPARAPAVWVDGATGGSTRVGDWSTAGSSRGGYSRDSGGWYPATMPADVMRGETSGERPYPWNNPVSDRHFAQQQGGPTSSRSSRKGRRSRRGMPTLNRRSRSGSRVQIQMPKGMTAPVPTILNGSPSAQEALAAALALRDR